MIVRRRPWVGFGVCVSPLPPATDEQMRARPAGPLCCRACFLLLALASFIEGAGAGTETRFASSTARQARHDYTVWLRETMAAENCGAVTTPACRESVVDPRARLARLRGGDDSDPALGAVTGGQADADSTGGEGRSSADKPIGASDAGRSQPGVLITGAGRGTEAGTEAGAEAGADWPRLAEPPRSGPWRGSDAQPQRSWSMGELMRHATRGLGLAPRAPSAGRGVGLKAGCPPAPARARPRPPAQRSGREDPSPPRGVTT
jgi:hypothetical protein